MCTLFPGGGTSSQHQDTILRVAGGYVLAHVRNCGHLSTATAKPSRVNDRIEEEKDEFKRKTGQRRNRKKNRELNEEEGDEETKTTEQTLVLFVRE